MVVGLCSLMYMAWHPKVLWHNLHSDYPPVDVAGNTVKVRLPLDCPSSLVGLHLLVRIIMCAPSPGRALSGRPSSSGTRRLFSASQVGRRFCSLGRALSVQTPQPLSSASLR